MGHDEFRRAPTPATCCSAPPAPSLEIPEEMERVERVFRRLNENVNILLERLAPVLVPPCPCPTACGEAENVPGSDLARSIRSLSVALDVLDSRVNNVRMALQI